MDQEKIGQFILKLRKEKNMTQQELAKRIGVTDRAISKWENGRGLPDLSLLKPLCNELGITINDLLSGDKVKPKESAEKFEENILKTIDYSNKRVRHVKRLGLFTAIFIVLIFVILFGMFCIDITRMRNNKPVFFSTWGYEYVPPINLDYENMENTIKDYLIKEDEKINQYENEKSFVAMRTYLLKEKSQTKYYIYAWVLKEKYYLKDDIIIKDTASSMPYKFELSKIDDNFTITEYDIPRDGSYYAKDMKHIFPNSVLEDMDNVHTDGTIERLSLEIQRDLNLYFHK